VSNKDNEKDRDSNKSQPSAAPTPEKRKAAPVLPAGANVRITLEDLSSRSYEVNHESEKGE